MSLRSSSVLDFDFAGFEEKKLAGEFAPYITPMSGRHPQRIQRSQKWQTPQRAPGWLPLPCHYSLPHVISRDKKAGL